MTESESNTLPGGDFRLFVQKLAMQGFYSLGKVSLPGHEPPEPNLGICKAVIDDLLVLREKTSGNLDDGEVQTLEKFIGDLQLAYLEQEKTSENAG